MSEAQRAVLETCGVNMRNQGQINTIGLRIDMLVDIWHEAMGRRKQGRSLPENH